MGIQTRLIVLWFIAFVFSIGLSTGPAGAASLNGGSDVAKSQTVEEQFLEKAKQLETCLEQDRYVEARLLLLQLQQLFPRLSFADRTTVEGIEAISETFVHLKQLLSGVQLQPDKIRHAARQFTLAADALIYTDVREQSRWKAQLEDLLAQLDAVRQAGKTHPNQQAVEKLLEGYDVLRPALSVRAPAAVVRELDAVHQHLRQLQLQRHPSAEEWPALLGQLAELYQQVIHGKDQPTLAEALRAPLTRLMMGLAAFLILSLTYTAWCYRTFRGTRRT